MKKHRALWVIIIVIVVLAAGGRGGGGGAYSLTGEPSSVTVSVTLSTAAVMDAYCA